MYLLVCLCVYLVCTLCEMNFYSASEEVAMKILFIMHDIAYCMSTSLVRCKAHVLYSGDCMPLSYINLPIQATELQDEVYRPIGLFTGDQTGTHK